VYGCDSLASLQLTISVLPVASIVPSGSFTFCPSAPVVLSAPVGMQSYSWSNGATTQTIAVREGTYSVQLVNLAGCISTNIVNTTLVNALPADFNYDGTVNISDYLVFAVVFNTTCQCVSDLDHDGDVDISDYLIFGPLFGQSCQ
jgi:hypothetical protein